MEADFIVVRRCVSNLLKQFDYKKKELNGKILKELISAIRKIDGIIPTFIDVIFEHLRRDDCDLRLGTLLIINHFFQRSHNFRLELSNSLQDLLVYTLETDPLHYPLPKPPEAVELLKKETLSMLRLWIDKFGPGYTKLQRIDHFLKNCKSLDWENSEANFLIDRERAEDERFQNELRAKKIVEHVSKLFNDSRPEIERIHIEANSVIELLFPRFVDTSNGETQADERLPNQLHSFGDSSGITIFVKANGVGIENTPENADLINQMRDTKKQLEKWHSKLTHWLGKLAETGDSSTLTRRIIDSKRLLAEGLQKCREFKVSTGDQNEMSTSDSDDSDFVDVELKEGYEPDFIGETSAGPSSCANSNNYNFYDSRPGPSGLKFTGSLRKNGNTNEDGRNDGKGPPKLAMGLDLKYWEEDGVKPARLVQNHSEEHWWRQSEKNSDESVPLEDAYRARQITFITERPAIERMCRAPLPSGKLCPRMQPNRCALHGPIIDRDEHGFPCTEQRQIENQNVRQKEREKREEEEFLMDVEAVTGAELNGPRKKGKGGRTARIREKPENVKARERLKTKLFDKRTMKRVSTTLEQIQKARAERNFANQFNYSISNKR